MQEPTDKPLKITHFTQNYTLHYALIGEKADLGLGGICQCNFGKWKH